MAGETPGGGWDDAAFFDRVGVMRPRTGATGVQGVGGMTAPSPMPMRPVVTQQPASAPTGRPASSPPVGQAPAPSSPFTPPSQVSPDSGVRGPISDVTLKFHPPEQPEPVPVQEPVQNPLGTPVTAPDGSSSMVLSPEGQNAHARESLRSDELFGPHPFSGDPHAPKPVTRPGKPSFNPFFGWSAGA